MVDFVRRAEAILKDILSRHKIPIMVGGSSLYVEGLLLGLPQHQARDPVASERLEADLRALGWDKGTPRSLNQL